MTLVVNSPNPKAIHAVVIGVGEYPWLIGGNQPTFAKAAGMGQLTSAPASAREFARWFLADLSHPELSDRTLDLLLSDAQGDTFTDAGGVAHQIERATMANVKKAVLAWAARGNADPDSILLFYFCGHGLGKGKQTVLLMEDFGSLNDTQSLQLAVDFDQMYWGADQCAARRQCFFVDACRVGTPFALNTLNYFGDPILIPSANALDPPRSAPVFYAAVPGTSAYGRSGQASFYTQSLLKSFAGSGADDTTGVWRVATDGINSGILPHLRRAVSNTAAQGQLSQADALTLPFVLHELSMPPVVPVEVTCAPSTYNATAQLSVSGAGAPLMLPSVAEGTWGLELTLGTYQFAVTLPPPAAAPPPEEREIRPPFRRFEVPVL
jgi:hypothetical protein